MSCVSGRWLLRVGLVLVILLAALVGGGIALVLLSEPGEVPNPSVKPGDHKQRTPPENGPWTIEEAQQFHDFELYWVGEEFAGLPLTEIDRLHTADDRQNYVLFAYGTCKLPNGEGGCSPPIQIRIQPFCGHSYPYPFSGNTSFRGEAEATRGGDPGHLDVWTGSIGMSIFAYGVGGTPQAVADALVSMNGLGPTDAGAALPAVRRSCA